MTVPLTENAILDREKLLQLVDEMRAAIPDDVLHAEEVLRSRDDLLAEAREAAQRIREEAEAVFKQRLDQHEVVAAAREQAQAIIAQSNEHAQDYLNRAEQDAAAKRQELDDYSLALLRRLEANLNAQIANIRGGIEGIMQESGGGPGAGPNPP